MTEMDEWPATKERLGPLLKDLRAQLGESPEAWRGAAMIASGIAGIAQQMVREDPDVSAAIVGLATISIALAIAELPECEDALEKHMERWPDRVANHREEHE